MGTPLSRLKRGGICDTQHLLLRSLRPSLRVLRKTGEGSIRFLQRTWRLGPQYQGLQLTPKDVAPIYMIDDGSGMRFGCYSVTYNQCIKQ
jgi:hypothetical protein